MRDAAPDSPAVEGLNNVYERALVSMHKMPRIWIEYLEFLVSQRWITRCRRAFDRALMALPITQHSRIWPAYLSFIGQRGIPEETAVRVSVRACGCCSRGLHDETRQQHVVNIHVLASLRKTLVLGGHPGEPDGRTVFCRQSPHTPRAHHHHRFRCTGATCGLSRRMRRSTSRIFAAGSGGARPPRGSPCS